MATVGGAGLLVLAVPTYLYFLHVAHRLRTRIRLSDGMMALGLFVLLPSSVLGPVTILGEAGIPAMAIGWYAGILGFVAMAVSWAKGEKSSMSMTPPALPGA